MHRYLIRLTIHSYAHLFTCIDLHKDDLIHICQHVRVFCFVLTFDYFEKPPTEYIGIDLIKSRY